MRRLAALLVAVTAASALGVATAPAASACTGLPCTAVCLVWHTAISQNCPIR